MFNLKVFDIKPVILEPATAEWLGWFFFHTLDTAWRISFLLNWCAFGHFYFRTYSHYGCCVLAWILVSVFVLSFSVCYSIYNHNALACMCINVNAILLYYILCLCFEDYQLSRTFTLVVDDDGRPSYHYRPQGTINGTATAQYANSLRNLVSETLVKESGSENILFFPKAKNLKAIPVFDLTGPVFYCDYMFFRTGWDSFYINLLYGRITIPNVLGSSGCYDSFVLWTGVQIPIIFIDLATSNHGFVLLDQEVPFNFEQKARQLYTLMSWFSPITLIILFNTPCFSLPVFSCDGTYLGTNLHEPECYFMVKLILYAHGFENCLMDMLENDLLRCKVFYNIVLGQVPECYTSDNFLTTWREDVAKFRDLKIFKWKDVAIRSFRKLPRPKKNSRIYSGKRNVNILRKSKITISTLTFISLINVVMSTVYQSEYDARRYNYYSSLLALVSIVVWIIKSIFESLPELNRLIQQYNNSKIQHPKQRYANRRSKSFDDVEKGVTYFKESREEFNLGLGSRETGVLFLTNITTLITLDVQNCSSIHTASVVANCGFYFAFLAKKIYAEDLFKRTIGSLIMKLNDSNAASSTLHSVLKRESFELETVGDIIRRAYSNSKKTFETLYLKEISAIMAICVVAATSPPLVNNHSLDFFIERCSRTLEVRGCSLDSIVDAVAHYSTFIVNAYKLGRIDFKLFSSDSTCMEEYYEIRAIMPRVITGHYTRDDGGDLQMLRKRVKSLMTKLQYVADNAHSFVKNKIYLEHKCYASGWLVEVTAKIEESSSRPPPFAITLYGVPGIGKSFMLEGLDNYIHKLMEIHEFRKTAMVGSVDKYDSTIGADTTCIILDDLGQNLNATTGTSTVDQLLRFNGSIAAQAVKAGVEEKGKITINHEILLITTNTPDAGLTDQCGTPMAMYRRFGFMYEVILHDDWKTPTGTLDIYKEDFKSHLTTIPDFLTFVPFYLKETGGTYEIIRGAALSNVEFLKKIKVDVMNHTCKRRDEIAQRVKTLEICSECKLPDEMCICAVKAVPESKEIVLSILDSFCGPYFINLISTRASDMVMFLAMKYSLSFLSLILLRWHLAFASLAIIIPFLRGKQMQTHMEWFICSSYVIMLLQRDYVWCFFCSSLIVFHFFVRPYVSHCLAKMFSFRSAMDCIQSCYRSLDSMGYLTTNKRNILVGLGSAAGLTGSFLLVKRMFYSLFSESANFDILSVPEQKKLSQKDVPWVPVRKISPTFKTKVSISETELVSLVRNNTIKARFKRGDGSSAVQHFLILNDNYAATCAHVWFSSSGDLSSQYHIESVDDKLKQELHVHSSMIYFDLDHDISIFPIVVKGFRDITRYLPSSVNGGYAIAKLVLDDKEILGSGSVKECSYDAGYRHLNSKLYSMDMNSASGIGYCGLPYVCKRESAFILGLHVAGSGNAFIRRTVCSPILHKHYKQAAHLNRNVNILTPEISGVNCRDFEEKFVTAEVHPKNAVNFLPVEISLVDAVKKDFTPSSNCRHTEFAQEVIEEFGIVNDYSKPVLKTSVAFRAPLVLGNYINIAFDRLVMEKSVDDYCEVINLLEVPKRAPYTTEEILNGCDETILGSIKASTSAGFPINKKKKEILLGEAGDWTLHDYQLKAIKNIEEDILSGRHNGLVFSAMPKDEPRPKEKTTARVFFSCPMYLYIIVAKYCNPLMEFMNLHCEEFEIALGVDCTSPKWHVLVKDFFQYSKHEKCMFASDYSAFDMTQSHYLRSAAMQVFRKIALAMQYDGESMHMLDQILAQIMCPLINFNGAVVACTKIMPSGVNLTAHGNSIVGALINRYVFFKYHTFNHRYRDHFIDLHLGDDNISRVLDTVDRTKWSPEIFQKEVAALGMFATSPLKDGPPEYLTEIDCEFLKRYSVYHEDLGYIVGALKKSSIFRPLIIYIHSKNQSKEEHFSEIFRNILLESVLWGKEFFDRVQIFLFSLAERHCLIWDDYHKPDYYMRIFTLRTTHEHTIDFSCPLRCPKLSSVVVEMEEESNVNVDTQGLMEIISDTTNVSNVVSSGLPRGFLNPIEASTTLSNWWERRVRLADIVITPNFFDPVAVKPFKSITSDIEMKEKFSGLASFRFDIEITFVINQASGIYGELWAVWYPLREHINFQDGFVYNTGTVFIAYISHFPHVRIDMEKDGITKMRLPWCSPYPMGNAYDTIDMGTLVLYSFTGTRTIFSDPTAKASCQVFANMSDVNIGGATSAREAQYFPKETLSSTLYSVSDAASLAKQYLSAMPALAVPAEMVAQGTKIGGHIAQMLGYSKPRQVSTEAVVTGYAAGPLATYNSNSTARSLALDEFHQTSVDPSITGFDMEDPLLIASLAKRKTWVRSEAWLTVNNAKDPLMQWEVSPARAVISTGSPSYYYFPPIAYVSSLFKSYSGGIYCYHLEAISHSSIGGMLEVSYEPLGALNSSMGSGANNRSILWDLRSTPTLLVKIGWNSSKSALLCNDNTIHGFEDQMGLDYSLGRVIVRTRGRLTTPTGVAASVIIRMGFYMEEPPLFFNYDNRSLTGFFIAGDNGVAVPMSNDIDYEDIELAPKGHTDDTIDGKWVKPIETRSTPKTTIAPPGPVLAPVRAPIAVPTGPTAPAVAPVTVPTLSGGAPAPRPSLRPVAPPLGATLAPVAGCVAPRAITMRPITGFLDMNGSTDMLSWPLKVSTEPLFRYYIPVTVVTFLLYIPYDPGYDYCFEFITDGGYVITSQGSNVKQFSPGIRPTGPFKFGPPGEYWSNCVISPEFRYPNGTETFKVGIASLDSQAPLKVYGVIMSCRPNEKSICVPMIQFTSPVRPVENLLTKFEVVLESRILKSTDAPFLVPRWVTDKGCSVIFVGSLAWVKADGTVVKSGVSPLKATTDLYHFGNGAQLYLSGDANVLYFRGTTATTSVIPIDYRRESEEAGVFSVMPSGINKEKVLRLQAGEEILSLRAILKIHSISVEGPFDDAEKVVDQYVSTRTPLPIPLHMCILACIGVTGNMVFGIATKADEPMAITGRMYNSFTNLGNFEFDRGPGLRMYENPSYSHELFSLGRGALMTTKSGWIPEFGLDGISSVQQGICLHKLWRVDAPQIQLIITKCIGESFNLTGFIGFPILIKT